ncbi:MAG: hypothetical protein DHS80DRAFT_32936 [Piptocephalis tieghemiana]|nr:MAG: hypothetical protein DHS80DRAFT_32936 [Piptocephalis tieghemiana]
MRLLLFSPLLLSLILLFLYPSGSSASPIPYNLYQCLGEDSFVFAASRYSEANRICKLFSGMDDTLVFQEGPFPICGSLNWYQCGDNTEESSPFYFSPITFHYRSLCDRFSGPSSYVPL